LQILEGERAQLQDLMLKFWRDVRHEAIVVLQEHEIPSAVFGGWRMACVSATPRQVAEWAGLCQHSTTTESPSTFGEERQRTARFAQDIRRCCTVTRP
jgi:ABC-type taurine transport system ATPase subunit